MTLPAVLEKVAHLVRLSASDSEHEARSAAFEACRLIRTHGLVVVAAPGPAPEPPAVAPPFRPGVPGSIPFRPGTPGYRQTPEEMARRAAELLNRPRPARNTTSAPPPRAPRPVVMASPATTPIQQRAKFPGRCEDCRNAYAQGDAIWYRRGVGSVHGACDPEALV